MTKEEIKVLAKKESDIYNWQDPRDGTFFQECYVIGFEECLKLKESETTSLKAEVEWMKKNIVNAMEWLKLDNNGVALICLENALYNQKDSKIPDAFESLQSRLVKMGNDNSHLEKELETAKETWLSTFNNCVILDEKLAKAEADKVELLDALIELKECLIFNGVMTETSHHLEKPNQLINKHGNNK